MNMKLNSTVSSRERACEYLMTVKAMPISETYQIYLQLLKSSPEKAKNLIKAKCYWNLPLFAKFFLPHFVPVEFARHHFELFRALPHGARGRKVNILAPRGSAKSTIMAVIVPLHRICYVDYDKVMGYAPERFIIIVSKSYQMAESRVKSIQAELESNEKLRTYFGNFVGKKHWGVKSLVTANGVQLEPKGRGGQIRGSLSRENRPSLIISDDLDDAEKVLNPDVRKKDQDWFDTDFLRAGALDGSTNFLNIDTIKHEEATASILRNRPGWTTHLYRAIEQPADLWHPTAESLWKEWEKMLTDMSLPDTERTANADTFYQQHQNAMTAGVKELWPEMITYLDVRKEICDVGYWAVLRELQNETRDPSKAIFDMDNAITFRVTADGFQRNDDRLVKWREMAGASLLLDWAGGKDSVDNAFAAVACVVWVPMPGGRTVNRDSLAGCQGYVYAAWLDRVKLSLQIKNAFDILEHVQSELVRCERPRFRFGIEDFIDTTGAIKEYVNLTFASERERRNSTVPLEFLTRYQNKIERIAALEPAISHGWLTFREGLPGEFMKQLSQFPTADFMDGPDALEGACQLRVNQFATVRRETRLRHQRREEDFRVEV